MSSTIRRAGVSVVAVATLALSTVGGAAAQPTTTTDDPAEAAAGWLTTQLTDGTHVYFDEFDFVDTGLTADIVYALAGVGVASDTIDAMADWLGTQAEHYVGPGATAKLIIAAEVAGHAPRDFGPDAVDLVATLEALEITDEPEEPVGPDERPGLYQGSFNSTLNQALALLALARVDDADPSARAIDLLLDQQCEEGGFSAVLLAEGESCSGGNVDTTAFAIDALLAVEQDQAAADAVQWLTATQASDGSFIGDGAPSSNSTGLAALALRLGGETARADLARDWVLDQQLGCDSDLPGAILAYPDGEGDALRATPQALLGVIGESLMQISAAGASADVPVLDCPDPTPVDRDLEVTCDADDVVLPGDRVTCGVAGLDAGEAVHVLVTLNPTLLDEDLTADADGVASFAFDVPADAREGDQITIRIDGEGDGVLASLSLTVGAPDDDATEPVEAEDDEPREATEADDDELPRTGTAAAVLGAAALILVALGSLLVATTRRRGMLV